MSQVQSQAVVDESAAITGVEGQLGVVGRSPWEVFWSRFRKDKIAVFATGFILLLIIIAFTAPLTAKFIAHHGANQLFDNETTDIGLPKGPDGKFWFGADQVGRDLFVRVLYGVRTSLIVALVATAISTFIGVVLGMMAGLFGGWVDTLISRAVDVVMSMPILLFAVAISATCSVSKKGCLGGFITPGLNLVIFIIALVNWTYIARIVRGQTFSIRQREFIEASRTLGAKNGRIMFREVLPNLAASIIVYATLIIPSNILFEAALSFLGVGIPQTTPSLGRELSDASSSQIFTYAWWMMVFPGMFLLFMTLAFNLVGDGLRDALDPRSGR